MLSSDSRFKKYEHYLLKKKMFSLMQLLLEESLATTKAL